MKKPTQSPAKPALEPVRDLSKIKGGRGFFLDPKGRSGTLGS